MKHEEILDYKMLKPMVADKARSTLWRWEQAGIFPKRVQIGPNSVGWRLSEVVHWLESKGQTKHAQKLPKGAR